MKEIELHDGAILGFIPGTQRLGIAEFTLCTAWKRGVCETAWLWRLQQENIVHTYMIRGRFRDVKVSSWTHRGIDEPRIWIQGWCAEHGGNFTRFYVPKRANCVTVSKLGRLHLIFDYQYVPVVG